MKTSGSDAKKKEFVQTVQEQVGRLAENLYAWMHEDARAVREVEAEVTQVMRRIGQGLLQAACQLYVPAYPAQEIACACGEQAPYVRRRTGKMKTQLGQLSFNRPYSLCAHCGQGTYPQDQALGFCAGSISAGLDELLAYVGSLLPFDEAAGLLEKLRGLHLSSRRIRQSTEGLGRRVKAHEAHAVAAAWEGTAPPGPPAAQSVPKRLYIAMDGIIVPMRHQAGKEQKLGAVYTTTAKPSRHRPEQLEVRAEQISFYTAQADAATFGQGLWLEAHRRGVAQAQEVVVIGDGAHWIWGLADEHFPHAIQILDWYHASQYIWHAAQAIYGATSDLGQQWAHQRLDQLWAGQVDQVLDRLQEHDQHKAVQEAVSYFTNNRQRMDYPRYRALGLQIGSGTIESGCKHVIAHRLKQAGMRWSEAGLQEVAKLRARLKSNRWEETAQLVPPPSRAYHRSAA